jgi:hypothetical protein
VEAEVRVFEDNFGVGNVLYTEESLLDSVSRPDSLLDVIEG